MANKLSSSIQWIAANVGRLVLALLVLIVLIAMIAFSAPSRVAYAGTAPGGNVVIRPTVTK